MSLLTAQPDIVCWMTLEVDEDKDEDVHVDEDDGDGDGDDDDDEECDPRHSHKPNDDSHLKMILVVDIIEAMESFVFGFLGPQWEGYAARARNSSYRRLIAFLPYALYISNNYN
uniref:HDC19485 n=1 Tax=Drosophila melanogaster TaxID=7227 RepID=Q6II85_DROME|nr:TPA_inf: HDC19485 [Drosophila melanogaster]